MATQIYFQMKDVTISWTEETNCAEIQWRGFVQGEPFRAGMDKALELVQEKKATRWLADLRQMRVASLEDQDWMAKDWMPRCIASGLRRSAVVLPQFALAQMAVRRIDQQSGAVPFALSYFDNLEEARHWLQIND